MAFSGTSGRSGAGVPLCRVPVEACGAGRKFAASQPVDFQMLGNLWANLPPGRRPEKVVNLPPPQAEQKRPAGRTVPFDRPRKQGGTGCVRRRPSSRGTNLVDTGLAAVHGRQQCSNAAIACPWRTSGRRCEEFLEWGVRRPSGVHLDVKGTSEALFPERRSWALETSARSTGADYTVAIGPIGPNFE